MAISDVDFIAWRYSSRAKRCILVRAVYKDLQSGLIETRLLSNYGYLDNVNNTYYEELIINDVSIRRRRDEFLAVSEIRLINAGGEIDDWMDFSWEGRSIEILLGDPKWPISDFRVKFTGITKTVKATDGELIIEVRDSKELFNTPLHTGTYPATDAVGQLYPVGLGDVFNASPVLTIDNTHEYQFHPINIDSISAIRANGVDASYTATLQWGFVNLTNLPFGKVTGDFKGDTVVNGYVETIADVVETIALFKGLAPGDIASDSFVDFNIQFPMAIGAYLTQRVNTLSFVQDLLGEVSGYWYFDELNKLRLWWLKSPTNNPLHVVTEDDYELGSFNVDDIESAAWKLRFGVNRNHTVQDADSLAGSLSELDRRKYSTEYVDIVEVSDNTIKTDYLLAEEPDLYRTHWRSGAAVAPEATRQLAIKATPHVVFSIRCKNYTPQTSQLALRLGDEVLVSIGRAGFLSLLNAFQLKTLGELDWGVDPLGAYSLNNYGLASAAILIGYTEYLESGTIEMQLWK